MQFFTRIFLSGINIRFSKIPIQHGTSTAAVCTILMFRFSLSVQISSKILFNSVSSVFPSLKNTTQLCDTVSDTASKELP